MVLAGANAKGAFNELDPDLAGFHRGRRNSDTVHLRGSRHLATFAWSAPPNGTKSLALIVDDPDAPDPKAPKMTWVHWVLYNLPPRPALPRHGGRALPPARARD